MWVPPFGHPWIYAYLQLPAAFRSLSRPSSAYSAWASALRPFSLDLCLLILRLSNSLLSQSSQTVRHITSQRCACIVKPYDRP